MATNKEQSFFHYMTYKQAISCMAFIGGFTDTVSYILLFKLFTSAITGNIVSATLPIYRSEPGFFPRALVIMSICLGGGCVTLYSMILRFGTKMNKWEIGLRLFSCELASLFTALWVGRNLQYNDIDTFNVFVQGCIMSFTMGIQNASALVLIPNCPPTTAMSGNTLRFAIYGAEAITFWLAANGYVNLYPKEDGKPPDYDEKMQQNAHIMASKFRVFLFSIVPFTLGAITGAPLALSIGMTALVVPIGVLLWLLFNIWMGLRDKNVKDALLAAKNTEKGMELTISPLPASTGLAVEGGDENESDGEVADKYKLFDDAYTLKDTTTERMSELEASRHIAPAP